MFDQYFQNWSSKLCSLPKLDSYNIFKKNFVEEKYLSCIESVKYRTALARFRCSAHKLAIEEGRFRNIERNNRFCTKCNLNQIETEYHFLLTCPLYRHLRTEFLPKYFITWPNIKKFELLMNSKNVKTINRLAKFVYFAMKLRNES